MEREKPVKVAPFKRTSMSDIARVAGVSVGVVSAVLSQGRSHSRASKQLAEKIRELAKEMHYVPSASARHLLGARTYTYGVLVASAGDPLTSFLVQYLDLVCAERQRSVIITNTVGNPLEGNNRFDSEVENLARRGVDGVFCLVHRWWQGNRNYLLSTHPNTVFYPDPGIEGAVFVEPDYAEMARILVMRALERGRRRVGVFLENAATPQARFFYDAFCREAAAAGIACGGDLVFDAGQEVVNCGRYDPVREQWSLPEGITGRAVDVLVGRGKADALFMQSDFWGADVLRVLRGRGLSVPGDISVMGAQNHHLADWVDPPLTSFSYEPLQAASMLVDLLEKKVEGALGDGERHRRVEPRLIVRESF